MTRTAHDTDTLTAPTMTELHDRAIAAGWRVTARRGGVTYYRTPTGKREWRGTERVSAGFWFLVNAVV